MFILIWMVCAGVASAQDCAKATMFVQQAFDLGENPNTFPEQKRLLAQALQLCPDHPEAHNNLAWILGEEKHFEEALLHYHAAIRAKPDYVDAWFGVGDAYQELKQFPLSLEAYLQVCKSDNDARQKAIVLLKNNRYNVSEEGEILNKESLLLLFDPARRNNLQRMLKECGFGSRAVVTPEFIFRNILFDVGQASLKPESLAQFAEIGAALVQINPNEIVIGGHTDKQWRSAVSEEEKKRLNLDLSKDRAASVAAELARLGVPRDHIITEGFGQMQPLVDEDTEAAYAQNRRVTIAVR